jgi:hypothetical protein
MSQSFLLSSPYKPQLGFVHEPQLSYKSLYIPSLKTKNIKLPPPTTQTDTQQILTSTDSQGSAEWKPLTQVSNPEELNSSYFGVPISFKQSSTTVGSSILVCSVSGNIVNCMSYVNLSNFSAGEVTVRLNSILENAFSSFQFPTDGDSFPIGTSHIIYNNNASGYTLTIYGRRIGSDNVMSVIINNFEATPTECKLFVTFNLILDS